MKSHYRTNDLNTKTYVCSLSSVFTVSESVVQIMLHNDKVMAMFALTPSHSSLSIYRWIVTCKYDSLEKSQKCNKLYSNNSSLSFQ